MATVRAVTGREVKLLPAFDLADFRRMTNLIFREGERVSVCRFHRDPDRNPDITHGLAKDAPARAAGLAREGDVFFGVHPLRAGIPTGQRGSVKDVTRVAALIVDLDLGKLAVEGMDAVEQGLCAALGGRQPVVRVFSGSGGRHLYWLVAEYPAADHVRAAGLAAAWGRLVKATANKHGGTADSVFDLARVLRVPGTKNRKDPDNPKPVMAEFYDNDNPDAEPDVVGLDDLEDALVAVGIPTEPVNRPQDDLAAEAVPVSDWPESSSCPYALTMIAGWAKDTPQARHPWLQSQCLRLYSGRRLGCLSKAEFGRGAQVLKARFEVLCRTTGQKREPKAHEVAGCLEWAQERVENRTLEATLADLQHGHYDGSTPGESADYSDSGGREDFTDGSETNPEPDAGTPPSGPTAAPGDRNADGLFAASKELALIWAFALQRMASPEAVLLVVLLRIAATIPPHVVLPPLIGGNGSLNTFVALVGPSGSGKGAAERAARDAVVLPQEVYVASVGSGEGLAHQYAHREKGGKLVRDRNSVLFVAPEVQGLGALGSRSGSTMDSQLRQGWSGEALGFAYADATKRLPIEEHSYRMGLSVGVQPEHADILLDASDGGTPQRLVWGRTTDPTVSRATRGEPIEPLTLKDLDWTISDEFGLPYVIPVCPEAEDMILAAHEARQRGEGDALDGHALFAREKLAVPIAVLHGRQEVTPKDWWLAGLVMTRSDQTRAEAQSVLAAAAAKRNHNIAVLRGRAEVVVETVKHNAGLNGAMKAIRKAIENGGGSTTRKAARTAAGRNRAYLDDALQALVTRGEVRVEGGRWVAASP